MFVPATIIAYELTTASGRHGTSAHTHGIFCARLVATEFCQSEDVAVVNKLVMV
jgi:hypothetical protein